MIKSRQFKIRLTREEERTLCRAARAGDKSARDRLIESQIPWALRLAKKYCRSDHWLEDWESEALTSLTRCVNHFDPDRFGTRFTTFAARVIVNDLHRWNVTNSLVKRTAHAAKQSSPDHAAFANASDGVPLSDADIVSAECPAWHTFDGVTPDELRSAVRRLPKRMRVIIRLRLRPRTLREIASAFQISSERVRQLEAVAVRHLRATLVC